MKTSRRRARKFTGMRKLTIGFLCVLVSVTLEAQQRRGAPAPGGPLAGLNAAQRAAFADGLDEFTEVDSVAEGLGPVFNERSCAACHTTPAIGGGSNTRMVTRFARRTGGVIDPLANLGG